MEGPSLVIATEELAPFVGRRLSAVSGTAAVASPDLVGKTLRRVESWGKHLLLRIGGDTYRIHFLMFGSYRIDDRRPDKPPKLSLAVAGHEVSFYTCAVGKLSEDQVRGYDPEIDVMSDRWSSARAVRSLAATPEVMLCDALMDQTRFAGVGNIIKNEVLYNLRLHPETKAGALTLPQRRSLVRETREYCFRFYEWKKRFELKRHWQIFRKRLCPSCGKKVTKRKTGKLQRVSHYCPRCQKRPSARRSTASCSEMESVLRERRSFSINRELTQEGLMGRRIHSPLFETVLPTSRARSNLLNLGKWSLIPSKKSASALSTSGMARKTNFLPDWVR